LGLVLLLSGLVWLVSVLLFSATRLFSLQPGNVLVPRPKPSHNNRVILICFFFMLVQGYFIISGLGVVDKKEKEEKEGK